MADVSPLRALRYDLGATRGLGPVLAPPYDVVEPAERAALLARSPRNAVALDLPAGPDPYDDAARRLAAWRDEGVLVREPVPALWALEQDFAGPDGRARTRRGILARVALEPYGPGRIRPHERTHPGPTADRLRLTRATRTNLSPIFSLYDDPDGAAWGALADAAAGAAPWGEGALDGVAHRLWPVRDPAAIDRARRALAGRELLIADGHHRYETSRAYAAEAGPGDGIDPARRWVYMCLVALQDPGLAVFPTHRGLTGLGPGRRAGLRAALEAAWTLERVERDAVVPGPGDPAAPLEVGMLTAEGAWRMALRDPAIVDARLPGRSAAYRRLDTAVLEALVLFDALGMDADDVAHLRGLRYFRTDAEALAAVDDGSCDVVFLVGAPPMALVRGIAAAGEAMPPKSTFFHPKVPTGLLFNPLDERH